MRLPRDVSGRQLATLLSRRGYVAAHFGITRKEPMEELFGGDV